MALAAVSLGMNVFKYWKNVFTFWASLILKHHYLTMNNNLSFACPPVLPRVPEMEGICVPLGSILLFFFEDCTLGHWVYVTSTFKKTCIPGDNYHRRSSSLLLCPLLYVGCLLNTTMSLCLFQYKRSVSGSSAVLQLHCSPWKSLRCKFQTFFCALECRSKWIHL